MGMLKGFCNKAILLLPDETYLTGLTYTTETYLERACINLVKFCKDNDIELEYFATNRLINIEDAKLINPLSEEDTIFMSNIYNMTSLKNVPTIDDKYLKPARDKYPTKRGLSKEDRLAIIIKREKTAVNLFLKDASFIIDMQKASTRVYKYESVENDCKIYLKINPSNYVPEIYMSGQRMSASDILGEGYNNPVRLW